MINLSSTLEAAQKAKRRLNPIVKVVLSNNGTTKTYLKDRILSITRTNTQWSHVVEITLHNADGVITALDFKGYKAIVSRGLVAAGDEYAALDPLWCLTHKYDSGRTEWAGLRPSTLKLIGVFDRMNLDHASEEYTPDSANTDTIKTLLTAVANATMQGFTHCQSFAITFDATEETLLDTFTPSDSFRVGFGESRLAVFKKLMAYVKSVPRVRNDEKIHILNPTVSGSTYAYEYKLDVEDEHTYFTEGYRRRLVVPNLIAVSSHPDSGTAVAGSADFAGYSTAADNALLDIQDFKRMRVTSDAEAKNVADAKIQKLEQAADKGYLVSTINVGQELFDYIKITDQRLGLDRVGNVGQIVERYKPSAPNPWQMTLNLGTTPTAIIPFIPGDFKGPVVTSEMWLQHLDDLSKFAELVMAILEDHELRITALEGGVTGRATKVLFDGATDTPTSAPWMLEAGLPFTMVTRLYFSPVIEEVLGVYVVYVIDRSTNFWKYNLTSKEWTELSSPTYDLDVAGTLDRSLALSPNGTKLACIGEGTANHRSGKRIEVYTIATDTWAASGQVQNMDDEIPLSQATVISGLVWADETTIWCWATKATTGAKDYARCIKYSVGDVFTIYAALLNGTLTYAEGYSAAINAAGTIIYGSAIGATVREWQKYTIAGDSYATGGTLTAGSAFALSTDRDKLWYVTTDNYRPGYIDTADDSENDDKFAENTERTASYGLYFGVADDATYIIAHAKSTAPRLMSVIAGGMYLLGTFYAYAGMCFVKLEKPNDNYPVTFIHTVSGAIHTSDQAEEFLVMDGEWKVFYPVVGDYTQIKITISRY